MLTQSDAVIKDVADRLQLDLQGFLDALMLKRGVISPGPSEIPHVFDRYLQAATELAEPNSTGHALPAEHPVGPLANYPTGPGFLAALRAGRSPRAMWQVTPSAALSGDWALGLATAARACAESDRGAVIIVPDQTASTGTPPCRNAMRTDSASGAR